MPSTTKTLEDPGPIATAPEPDHAPLLEAFDRLASDVCLDVKKVSAVLSISVSTLNDWRLRGFPPPWVKANGRVIYRAGALRDWLHECETQEPTGTTTQRRRDELEALPIPQRSRHASFAAFTTHGSTTDTWPFLLSEPTGRPLDAVEALANEEIEGPVEWMTLEQYSEAWKKAVTLIYVQEDKVLLPGRPEEEGDPEKPKRIL